MAGTSLLVANREAGQDVRWAVAGRLADALTRRDFLQLESGLDPGTRFRAELMCSGFQPQYTAPHVRSPGRRHDAPPSRGERCSQPLNRLGLKGVQA